ncbi:serine/threonine protein kinase [Pendulispora brunnea]|uniref:Serine/threonine protein kinase n=1 Tax=Pendulispora brunnea TaxID=2905690 RepID=A0ABZ2KNM0_9BACT
MTGAPSLPRGSVRRGGKEELRASILKTYLLRIRAEKGERAARALLNSAGIDPAIVDNETGWLSVGAARRALRALAQQLGPSALRHRGEYVTHPEALGTLVRMLRIAEQPIDAYRYLAANAREVTRIGTWELEELGPKTSKSIKSRTSDRAVVDAVRMTYRLRDDAVEDPDRHDAREEELLCAAREGELGGIPRIWGLQDAEITHNTCIAKGADACVYTVRWRSTVPRTGAPLGGTMAAIGCGATIAATGGWVAGSIAAVLGALLGGGAGYLWDRNREDRSARSFEKNRIAALERGLELRGELGSTPGELTGTVLGGKYRIGRKIGSGGIGVVYAAEHVSLGHEVAIKVLRGAAARDGGEIARLRREAYIQVHVEHPNVVRVLDLDQMPDGSIYVVMERLVGRSLADKLGREGALAPGFALPVFIGVCRALGAAHQKGVVHRDLKPGNIFLLEDGSSKVLDFGMSKLTTAESLTQAGYTLGTPEYMAPEQCIGAAVEARTDIYALGCLMYEALTSELPIVAQSRRELLDLHQRQVPTPMRTRRPDLPIPEALDDAVMKCLKKKVADRPHSANELADMLEAIPRDGLPTSYPLGVARRPPPTTRPPPARDRDATNGKKEDARDDKKDPAAGATGAGAGHGTAKPPVTSN